jgi:hypothetical protein
MSIKCSSGAELLVWPLMVFCEPEKIELNDCLDLLKTLLKAA